MAKSTGELACWQASRTLPAKPGAVAAISVCVSTAFATPLVRADAPAPSDPTTAQNNDGTLEQVVVQGLGSLLENKLPQNLQDTPQSITAVSEKLMAEQATTRLEDALKNVPGIT